MTLAAGVGSLFSTATGALLVAMGAYIWRVAPRRRENTALAVFTAAWGLVVVAGWVVTPDDPWFSPLWLISSGPVSYALAASAIALAHSFGGRDAPPVERRRLRWVAPMAYLPVPIGLAFEASLPSFASFMPFGEGPIGRLGRALIATGWAAALSSMVLLLALAALRYPRAARERPEAANAILLLTFGVGAYCAQQFATPPGGSPLLPLAGVLAVLGDAPAYVANATIVALVALWLRNTSRAPPPYAARARWAAWVLLAAMLVGFLLRYGTRPYDQVAGVVIGLLRLFAIAALAYAILRTQLLGIDVKLRWGISKSTVAAVFVAVFFVASEAAQEFLGGTLGGQYVGIAAAGALVFALAPLQRAAERLAEKAVPSTMAPAPGRRGSAELYRVAARKFLADGRLSDDDELALAELAQHLGIGAGDAMALRKDVEREAAHGASTRREVV